jgi:hypothetical protein
VKYVYYNGFDETTKKKTNISLLLENDNRTFCQYCERYEDCDRKNKPRILAVCWKILKYLHEEKRGRLDYPFAGSWEHQPEWFIEMLNAARNQDIEVHNG